MSKREINTEYKPYNFVKLFGKGEHLFEIEYFSDGFAFCVDYYIAKQVDKLIPISITNNWLKAFGFKGNDFQVDINRKFVYISYDKRRKTLFVKDRDKKKIVDIANEIEYVHQLQNFCKTLKVKLKKINLTKFENENCNSRL